MITQSYPQIHETEKCDGGQRVKGIEGGSPKTLARESFAGVRF
jgi:hypothetical protein